MNPDTNKCPTTNKNTNTAFNKKMNPDTTPTPRTDEAVEAMGLKAFVVPVEICRQLERELTEKTNEVERLREELDRLKRGCQGSCYACEPVGEMNLKLEAEVARLTRSRS